MFEKEAKERARKLEESQTLGVYDSDEDYARDSGWNDGEVAGYEEGFKDGAEFGYNKANEWHFVKDELPRKSDATLCERMAVFVAVKVGYNVSTYGTYWNLRLGKFECLDEVYAWCYAPEPPELPKEIEEK